MAENNQMNGTNSLILRLMEKLDTRMDSFERLLRETRDKIIIIEAQNHAENISLLDEKASSLEKRITYLETRGKMILSIIIFGITALANGVFIMLKSVFGF